MQVNQANDYVTHAAIGVGQVQELEISNSAEFLHVISDSLYSNKPRAVVREVLCNAWDAHIEAGCTDLPVEVTLNDDALTIRDFGTGIAPAKIVPIYGTYGQSTKLHDGKQTGGFGLGSKAPFAYTDHFEVISCHAGTKTIYNMEKASVRTGGKPAIQTILSVPTDETGISVTVGLKSKHNKHTFQDLIHQIAMFGGMKVKLNGVLCDTLDFDQAKHGFLALNEYYDRAKAGLFVRYGNVIYPVPDHETYQHKLSVLRTVFNNIGYNHRSMGGYMVILQAQPNSISITPSRESLSMTEHTVTTLTGLIHNVLKSIVVVAEQNQKLWSDEALERCWKNLEFPKLFNSNLLFDHNFISRNLRENIITDPTELARFYVYDVYQAKQELRTRDIRKRINSLIQGGMDTTGNLRKLLKYHPSLDRLGSREWIRRNIAKPLSKAMTTRTKEMDPSRLFFFGRSKYGNVRFCKTRELHHLNIFEMMHLASGQIILAHSQEAFRNRAHMTPVSRSFFGNLEEGILVYLVPRTKPNHIDEARAFFAKRGYTITDLTRQNSWEPELPKPALNTKTSFGGMAMLSSILDGDEILPRRLNDPNFRINIDKPKFIVRINENNDKFAELNKKQTLLVIREYGNQGAVTLSSSKLSNELKRGLPKMIDWLVDQLKREVKQNASMKRFLETNSYLHHALSGAYDQYRLVKVILDDAELAKHYGLTNTLTSTEKMKLDILLGERSYVELAKEMKLKPVAAAKKLVTMMQASKRLDFIDVSEIYDVSFYNNKPEPQASAREVIKFTLKG